MARKSGKDRLYTRAQGKGGVLRYYADLRDLGHGRVALKSSASGRATDDPDEARILLGELLKDIRAGKVPAMKARPKRQRGDETRLGPMAERYIKYNPGDVTPKWLGDQKRMLERAKKEFGTDRPLISIEAKHLEKWIRKLKASGKANGTIRHHAYALSVVYEYAQSIGTVPSAFNPVLDVYRLPSARRERAVSKRAKFLEIPDAAKVLEAARKLQRTPKGGLIEFVYPLIATFLLTGGNKAEVLGLTWGNIDFDLKFVTFKPNKWRSLKRPWRERTVPLWPQLAPILKAHRKKKGDGLVFPSPRLAYIGTEGMINDVRKIMRDVKKESGVDLPGGVTIFRHTYATARLQTTPHRTLLSN